MEEMMMSILTSDQVRSLTASAMRDSAFKQALLENPRAAVHESLGEVIPADKTLHVLQREGPSVTGVIPQAPPDWPSGLSREAAMERFRNEVPELAGNVHRTVEFHMQLIARAWQDEAFKQRLLHDPKGTVREALGIELPDDLSLDFVADDDTNQYVVLPPEPRDTELTDEQLEQIAGGEVILVSVSVSVGFPAATAALAVSISSSW